MIFAGIERAHLEIAYDNGGIHRGRSERVAKTELRRFLGTVPYELREIDAGLSSLSEEQLQVVCAGEETEQIAVLANAPPFTDALLNEIFEEVC